MTERNRHNGYDMELNEEELHTVAKKHAQGMRQYKFYLHPQMVRQVQKLFPDMTRQDAMVAALQGSVAAIPLRDKLTRLLHRWQAQTHDTETTAILLQELQSLLELSEERQ